MKNNTFHGIMIKYYELTGKEQKSVSLSKLIDWH